MAGWTRRVSLLLAICVVQCLSAALGAPCALSRGLPSRPSDSRLTRGCMRLRGGKLNPALYPWLLSGGHLIPNYYEELGVDADASAAEIRKRFKELVISYHPDKLRDSSSSEDEAEAASRRFLAVRDAWEVLGDEDARRAYDDFLAGRDTARSHYIPHASCAAAVPCPEESKATFSFGSKNRFGFF